MALDLILGPTHRSWGRTCLGAFPTVSRAQDRERYEDVRAELEVADLARTVATEIQLNYHRIVRLVTAKKMPTAERRDFGKFLAKWQAFSMPREGRYRGADYVALANFRDANRRVSARLAELDAAAPAAASPPVAAPQSVPAAPTAVRLAAGIAIGLAGILASRKILDSFHS